MKLDKYKFLLWGTIIGKLGDVGTTYYFVNHWGSDKEANRFVRYLIDHLGALSAMTILFIVNALMTTILYLHKAQQPKTTLFWLYFMFGLMILLTAWNGLNIYLFSHFHN